MAEVSQMSQATHERPYTVEWELRGNIDTSRQGNRMLADTKGRAGVLLNGDRYVQLAYTGFVHKGDQAWYLRVKADGSWFSEGPEQGGLHQRPGIMMWEGIQPDQLGVLDAIARSRGSFRRTSVLPDLEVWTSAIPPRKSSVDLFKSPREVVEFNITVKKFGEVSLPIKFHLTWWDFGTIISFDGAYDWNPPVFPQVSEKAVMADAPWG